MANITLALTRMKRIHLIYSNKVVMNPMHYSKSSAVKLTLGGVLMGLMLSIGVSSANAVPLQPTPAMQKMAAYTGADRQQQLLDGAKKEGQILIYTSAPVDDMRVITDAFTKKYGIKVITWRSSSENVLQRSVSEANAKHFDMDVIETNGPEMEALHREGLLQKVNSPYLADLIPQAILPHGEWVGTRLNIFAYAYNTNLVKKADLPKTYMDLLDPKWKGKLGIEESDLDWMAGVVTDMAAQKGMDEKKALDVFRKIAATNGFSVRKGHTLLVNLVASGEVPLALTVYNYKVEEMKNSGAPVDWGWIAPAIARPNGVGVARQAKHPNAAILFYDFMISDAQKLLLARQFVPTSTKVDTKLNKMPLKFIDPNIILDQNKKWTDLYEQIVVRQGK
ncbi:MAG: fbpA 2 [Herbaspirillum sp.]|jgi:iron(III) transport system substrate-binding protein|nr:fbpA 2 [Herbaspirillum sp.]